MTERKWAAYAKTRNLSRNRLLMARHSELVDHFVGIFGQVDTSKRVLDIGPGNGFFMVLLRELGFSQVEGLEVSPVFLDVLRSKALTAQPGDIAAGTGLEKLSPPYDVVLLMEILEHLEDPLRALKHARGLLADDGFVYVTVPICDCIFDRVGLMVRGTSRAEQVKRIDETHLHAFSPPQIKSLLVQSGFTVKATYRISMRPPLFTRYSPGQRSYLLLRALLPDAFRGYFLCVVADGRDRS